MTRARGATCYICGENEAQTLDHVFPKQLFERPRPPLLTAPGCKTCQKQMQPDEEYFRLFALAGAYSDPTARRLWDGPIVRWFAKRPAIRDRLAAALQTMHVRTPLGLIVGTLIGIEGEKDRIGNVLRKIVRGLYWTETGNVMPLDVDFSFEQITPSNHGAPEVRELLASAPLSEIGSVVKYKFPLWDGDPPGLTVSWFAFYSHAMFTVGTGPADPDAAPPFAPAPAS